MLRVDDTLSPTPSPPPPVCDCEKPIGVLLQVPSHDGTLLSSHNTKPSLNEVAPVLGTEPADKARHRIWL
eukprot:1128841-Prorocentrum_lima.AAC.1